MAILKEIELQAFRSNIQLLTEVLPKLKGTYPLSIGLDEYLGWQMNKNAKSMYFRGGEIEIVSVKKELRTKRQRYDPLHKLFKEWAKSEKTPLEHKEHKFDNVVMFTERITDIPRFRNRLSHSLKDIVALTAHNLTVFEMVTLTCSGDKDSLFKLIKLDKVFLTSAIFQDYVWIAQGQEDENFFKSLSRAVTHDTFRNYIRSAKMGIACYLLWYLGYSEHTYKELLEFIESEGIAHYDDIDSFRRALNRIGLSKRHMK